MKGSLLLLWGENTSAVIWVADRQYLRSCQQDELRLGFRELTSYSASTNPQIKLCEQLGHREGETSVSIWPKVHARKWTWNREGLRVGKDRLEICLLKSLNHSMVSTIKIVIVQVLCCQQWEQYFFSFKSNTAPSYFVTDGVLVPGWVVLPWWDSPAPLRQLFQSQLQYLSIRLCWEERKNMMLPNFWVQVLLDSCPIKNKKILYL